MPANGFGCVSCTFLAHVHSLPCQEGLKTGSGIRGIEGVFSSSFPDVCPCNPKPLMMDWAYGKSSHFPLHG